MKVLIVGCGAQGSVIATDLIPDPVVDELVCADINLEKAEHLVKRLKSKKASAGLADASKIEDVVKGARGTDIIVNATTWNLKYNLNIMEAALRTRAHYLDMASDPFPQLELNGRFEAAGLTALIDAGCDPGISNVMAREGADRLDHVNAIRIRHYTCVEGREIISTWCPETAWHDMAIEPTVFENGEYKKLPQFSGEEVYKFPDPVGPQTVFYHDHEEPVTLPHFIGKGIKYADYKLGGPVLQLAKQLYRLGLLGTEPVDVKGAKITPLDLFFTLIPPTPSMDEMEEKVKAGTIIDAHACTVVEVDGEKAGKKVRYTLYTPYMSLREMNKRIPGTTETSYRVGVPAAILTKLLGKGKIRTKGVIPPECLDKDVRGLFIAELAKKGIVIYEKTEKVLNTM